MKMKKLLLLCLALPIGFLTFGQIHKMKPGFKAEKAVIQNMIAIDPAATPLKQLPVAPKPKPVNNNRDNPNIVTILDIGTSANGFGYGYWGGQKTMVWADDNLKAVVNIHRMGPGSSPPSFTGYLAGDLGTNYGATQSDWQQNRQIYAAMLDGGQTYYLDAARYPQGGIYNPVGNTALENAYITYYAANLSNAPGGNNWGGMSYGVDNCANQADSTKHLFWYDPPPYTYIPDGYAISRNGVVLVTDIDQEWAGATLVGYQGNIIVDRGTWNAATNDFDYTMFTLPFPTTNSMRPSSDRVAFSPDGQTAWMVILSNNMTNLDSNIYPIVSKSTNAGLTWSAPKDVILDGPTGIPGITQHLLSDYRMAQVFDPVPAREEVAYTTGFDCRISVDKWGNPHIGVVVGICAGGYSISTPNSPPPNAYDSTFAVYDIYSVDGGTTWSGQLMGYLSSFRGDFQATGSTAVYEDNRTCISTNMTGDKVFLSWNDTQVSDYINNNECDIFARGFDLVENKITKNNSDHVGDCAPDNVTFLSDIFQEANFQCLSYYVFSDYPTANKWTLPIVAEFLTASQDIGLPVDFKYIPDFSYSQDDFICDVFAENAGFQTGINEAKKDAALDMNIFPNPFKGASNVSVSVPKRGNLSMEITNIVGQKMMTVEKGYVDAGRQSIAIDGSNLSAGVYFCTIRLDNQSSTRKMIVR
jgi:hypothetical protein